MTTKEQNIRNWCAVHCDDLNNSKIVSLLKIVFDKEETFEVIEDKYLHAKTKIQTAIDNLNKLVSNTVDQLQVNIEIDQVNKPYQNPAAMPAPVRPAPANYPPPQAPPAIKAFNITPNFTLKRFSKEF